MYVTIEKKGREGKERENKIKKNHQMDSECFLFV